MDRKVFFSQKTAAALVLLLLILTQQVCPSPVVSLDPASDPQTSLKTSLKTSLRSSGQTLKRVARMTPLWRIMNSKPFGAYCQNNYECSTGLCRSGFCATMHRTVTSSVTN